MPRGIRNGIDIVLGHYGLGSSEKGPGDVQFALMQLAKIRKCNGGLPLKISGYAPSGRKIGVTLKETNEKYKYEVISISNNDECTLYVKNSETLFLDQLIDGVDIHKYLETDDEQHPIIGIAECEKNPELLQDISDLSRMGKRVASWWKDDFNHRYWPNEEDTESDAHSACN